MNKKFKYNPESRRLLFKVNNQTRFRTIPYLLGVSDTSISCGIFEVNNINYVAQAVKQKLTGLFKPKEIEEALVEVIKSNLIWHKEEEDINGAMYLFSTNMTKNNSISLINSVLNNLSVTATENIKNPNSGNFIKLWVVPFENIH